MSTRNMGPRKDIRGRTFTYLTPQEYIKGGKWLCLCRCGNTVIVDLRNLHSGHTKSCGCYQKEMAAKNAIDIVGMTYGCLEVLNRAGSNANGQSSWNCICHNCGRTFIASGRHLKSGSTQSCGCLRSLNEKRIIQMLKEADVKFSYQYTFDDLRGVHGGALRFDFAIFDSDGCLVKLVEYNGSQHYNKAAGSWAADYDNLVENDARKKQYCETHNIPLRIIKYNENYTLEDLISPEPVEAIS